MSKPIRLSETEIPSTEPALVAIPDISPSASAPPAPVEDLVLVQNAQQGDVAAYDELVRRYQERIYSTIYHMTSNHEDAVDLAQETFIKGFQALKSFKGDSSFYT